MHPQHNGDPSRDEHEDAAQQGAQDCFSDVGTDQPATQAGNLLEEHEPRLKYHRLGSDADTDSLLAEDAATCLCVSDKLLALGTKNGTVCILDYSGDKVSPVDGQGCSCIVRYKGHCRLPLNGSG